MSGFMQLANVENATSIWEFDPSLAHNCVLTNELDVVAAVQTVAIKVIVLTFTLVGALLTDLLPKDSILGTAYRIFQQSSSKMWFSGPTQDSST